MQDDPISKMWVAYAKARAIVWATCTLVSFTALIATIVLSIFVETFPYSQIVEIFVISVVCSTLAPKFVERGDKKI